MTNYTNFTVILSSDCGFSHCQVSLIIYLLCDLLVLTGTAWIKYNWEQQDFADVISVLGLSVHTILIHLRSQDRHLDLSSSFSRMVLECPHIHGWGEHTLTFIHEVPWSSFSVLLFFSNGNVESNWFALCKAEAGI